MKHQKIYLIQNAVWMPLVPTTIRSFIHKVVVANLSFFIQTVTFCSYVLNVDAALGVTQMTSFSAIW